MTRNFKDLYSSNFAPLITRTQEDFNRWSVLKLSLAAQINSVKMNTLPKYLYLFQCIPIFLPQHFFRKIDSMILSFIWDGKTPRLRKQFLQRPKSLGGMALPNLRFYYWAANLRIILFWIQFDSFHPPPVWLSIESSSCRPVSLSALAHSPIGNSSSKYTKNIIVKASLRIWNQFKRHFGFQTLSLLAPISPNHIFPPSLIDNAFEIWSNKGIKAFKDLYIDNTFASFQQLAQKFSLPNHHFFRYLQVRNFITRMFPQFPGRPPETSLDIFLQPVPNLKGMISCIYEDIHSISSVSLDSIKTLWEGEMGDEISEDVWDDILTNVHRSSICARHGLIQFKIVHRAHFTKVRLSKIYDVDPTCDRCHQAPASHLHMFWSCAVLQPYWVGIFESLSKVVGRPVEPNAITALFGVTSPTLSLSSVEAAFVAFVTLLARRLILFRWKSPTPPTHTSWIKDILNYVKLERIRCLLNGSLKKFYKMWDPFFSHYTELSLPNISD